jgi:hypothetical protein
MQPEGGVVLTRFAPSKEDQKNKADGDQNTSEREKEVEVR